jgi:hypothetical protein
MGGIIGPEWFHHYGAKMNLVEHDENSVIIKSKVASLAVRRSLVGSGYIIEWIIEHGPVAYARGNIWMNDSELASAFGLSDDIGEFGKWLIERFGGTTAAQGKFIRYNEYLNIPGPGTGHDGDPNISIILDDDIWGAIGHILVAHS